MRVLQISAAYKPAYIYGGPTMSVAMLCEQLVKAGCHISMFATTANGPAELDVNPNETLIVDGVCVTYFKRITKDHSHLSPALLKAVWQNAKAYDVVHIHAWWNLVSVLSCLIAVIRGVPVVVSARGTLSPYSFQNKNKTIKSLIHHLLSRPVLKRCHIHATSQRENEAVNSIVNPKSITTIPNFVKLPVYQPQVQKTVSTPIKLIFFSRIEEKKGLDILISALALVKTPFHLTIAGNGNQAYVESLKLLANDKGLADKVTWAGFINEDKFEILGQHDLFILPSHDENFGNAVIESLSAGTPVLISHEVGLANYVNINKLGWLCNTNADSVAQIIDQIAARSEELTRIRAQAPPIIYHDFGTDSLVEKYIGLYRKISKQH
ncbi:XrtY-associated glycosyltransferase XYAG1 [Mucilaginibacter sp. FT3.2]|uniref:XrtY-associated glycosyltransferase XYAG1 n=1 Tax=Mucilaginibacter sp. FT3.2 TaxID=2723090 RepID=UPI00160A579B|nr:glycosyltransferase [Mucilaginibacter sp. FT3.2]MBB6231318.1 glycosyltransferase involved in cell wall biosynthesis [Mucilaginibacter sp. FT3.2]